MLVSISKRYVYPSFPCWAICITPFQKRGFLWCSTRCNYWWWWEGIILSSFSSCVIISHQQCMGNLPFDFVVSLMGWILPGVAPVLKLHIYRQAPIIIWFKEWRTHYFIHHVWKNGKKKHNSIFLWLAKKTAICWFFSLNKKGVAQIPKIRIQKFLEFFIYEF